MGIGIAASSGAAAAEPEGGGLRPGVRKRATAVVKREAAGALVLLVEDDRDNREMYRQYLEWEGFQVVEATDGLQAFRRAAARDPTVIVTDLTLPRLDGWEAVRRIKANPGTRHIPVIALSAHAFVDDAGRAHAAGCDAYLAKPCLPEELAKAIRSLLKRRGVASPARRASRRPAKEVVPPLSKNGDGPPSARGLNGDTRVPPGGRDAAGVRRSPGRRRAGAP
jgi:two-component system cell cycle response regulator DivK